MVTNEFLELSLRLTFLTQISQSGKVILKLELKGFKVLGLVGITKHLRVIRNAWHSRFESALVFTAQWVRVSGGVAHYLTRRYAFRTDRGNNDKENTGFTLSGGYFL
ncbi:hypothetical protein VoSk93_00390 [Vibrio owensii]